MFDHLGDALTVLRLLRRLSQSELAERAGIRPNQISRYETGAVQPQLAQLERILDALGVGLPEFFYVLSSVNRMAALMADADQRQGPEALATASAVAYWQRVADQHVELAERVACFVQGEVQPGAR